MKAIVITDLNFGDSGKGAFTDHLAAKYNATAVVRTNGGPQCGHNVVVEDRHHCFHQFGSGSFSGVQTMLHHQMLLDPYALVREADALEAFGVVHKPIVHADCRIITPYQQWINQAREIGRRNRHGSCGFGVGETVQDHLEHKLVLRVSDLLQGVTHVTRILERIRDRKLTDFYNISFHTLEHDDLAETTASRKALRNETMSQMIAEHYVEVFLPSIMVMQEDDFNAELTRRIDQGLVLFEGAQGVLLDDLFGFAPHHTWSNIVPITAYDLLRSLGVYGDDVFHVGLTRAYTTRHGAGPLPTYSRRLTAEYVDPHNPTNPWQQNFRVGWLDFVLLRYALTCCERSDVPVNGIGLSHMDHVMDRLLAGKLEICNSYHVNYGELDTLRHPHSLAEQRALTTQLFQALPVTQVTKKLTHTIEEILGLPIVMDSFGADRTKKHDVLTGIPCLS